MSLDTDSEQVFLVDIGPKSFQSEAVSRATKPDSKPCLGSEYAVRIVQEARKNDFAGQTNNLSRRATSMFKVNRKEAPIFEIPIHFPQRSSKLGS